MGETTLFGYSTGPMVSGANVSYIDAKLLNNGQKSAQVRVKQYDLEAQKKRLLLDASLTIKPHGSIYLGLMLLDTWEVQLICSSPLVRCWIGCLDSDLNLDAGSVFSHRQLIPFRASSLQSVPRRRQPEILPNGFRR